MYKVKCTGKNKNYGDDGEVRLVADNYLNVGLRNNWFTVIGYEGSAKPDSIYSMKQQVLNIDRDMKILQLKRKLIVERLERRKNENGNHKGTN